MQATAAIRFGHSPDPDDAYMFYGFAAGGITVGGRPVEHVLEDIESLNRRALHGELEITAVSAHAYAHVADRYFVMRTGASVGRGYGPLVVSRSPGNLEAVTDRIVAIPGEWTTAALVFRLFAPKCELVVRPFDRILDEVVEGRADAGVLIHEGQLTYAASGLHKLADLGERWRQETGLPLPLGLDVVRRDLGRELATEASRALRRSIEYARAHEDEAIDYALQYGRGLDRELGRKFVGMYVNEDTLDLGDEGERALREMYDRAAAQNLIPTRPTVEIVG